MNDDNNQVIELSKRLKFPEFLEISKKWVWHKFPTGTREAHFLRRKGNGYDLSIMFRGYSTDDEFSVAALDHQTENFLLEEYRQVDPKHIFQVGEYDKKLFVQTIFWVAKFRKKNLNCSSCGRLRKLAEIVPGFYYCVYCNS